MTASCVVAEDMESILKRIPTKTLTSIDEVMMLIAEQGFDQEINRFRSSFLYRGIYKQHFRETVKINSPR